MPVMAKEPKEVRRVAKAPDGRRYTVIGMAKDWKLGTGSVVLDAVAFLWAIVRQARGKEWTVSVRPIESKSGRPVVSRVVKNHEEAVACVAELADAIESGQLTPPA
jgi:hypothetical protein